MEVQDLSLTTRRIIRRLTIDAPADVTFAALCGRLHVTNAREA